jgi:hypothetical protein
VWESAVVCTGNVDTLMDCGGAARTVTAFDYQTFVQAYDPSTPFLQVQQPVTCTNIGYDACTGRWFQADAWSWSPSNGYWYGPTGFAEFAPCNEHGIRWNELGAFFTPGSEFFVPARGYWAKAPPC